MPTCLLRNSATGEIINSEIQISPPLRDFKGETDDDRENARKRLMEDPKRRAAYYSDWFYKKYKSKPVNFLSVSADHRDDIEKYVLPFMDRQRIPFPVEVVGGESPDALVKAIDPQWQASLPATYVYSATGELVRRWYTQVTLKEIAKVVEPMIGGDGSQEVGGRRQRPKSRRD